eukprot:TRINITY_DN35957_c0_g1_i1.p1 TRINITY_DN35957_c0_g1~~TRINITY_DN35957_c0_g1_i1.p1  ORF type:complete len:675 (-),score=124.68 TRINITY_DN35957_c0_g1_i1:592-2391(-)
MVMDRLLVEENQSTDPSRSSGRDSDRGSLSRQCEGYICSSVMAAYLRFEEEMDRKAPENAKTTIHPLARVARDLRDLMQRERDLFSPVLLLWNGVAVATAASLLHTLYGRLLKPFLESVSVLTDEVRQVLSAADTLETYLIGLVDEAPEDADVESLMALREAMHPYEVADVAGTILTRWVTAQLTKMQEWIERSLEKEAWDPVGKVTRHAFSAVEVFRIIEEALEAFFALSLPMRLGQLKALTSGIDNLVQLYANRVVAQLGHKDDLLPPPAALTRFKKDVAVKVATQQVVKKPGRDPRLADEGRAAQLDSFTATNLCVRLNSLHFCAVQLHAVEESTRERWRGRSAADGAAGKINQADKTASRKMPVKASDDLANLFDPSRRVVNVSIDKVCDFLGAKVIFWDMREPFLEELYRVSVSAARIEHVVGLLDPVLAELCEVITDSLRDRVVLALLQASLGGLLRVLLDGGPARVFAESDADMLDTDLQILKDFFVADGDGLPRGVVENTAAPVQQILNLYTLDTNTVIDSFRQASDVLAQSPGTPLKGSSFSSGLPAASPGVRGRSAMDADTLLRVLCHRADREASKFLKKHYRLPKTVS